MFISKLHLILTLVAGMLIGFSIPMQQNISPLSNCGLFAGLFLALLTFPAVWKKITNGDVS